MSRPWTPGPWSVVHYHEAHAAWVSTGSPDHSCVQVNYLGNPPANADLIALAPEMAEAILEQPTGVHDKGCSCAGCLLQTVADKLRQIG
jgi:hypothetical protein